MHYICETTEFWLVSSLTRFTMVVYEIFSFKFSVHCSAKKLPQTVIVKLFYGPVRNVHFTATQDVFQSAFLYEKKS